VSKYLQKEKIKYDNLCTRVAICFKHQCGFEDYVSDIYGSLLSFMQSQNLDNTSMKYLIDRGQGDKIPRHNEYLIATIKNLHQNNTNEDVNEYSYRLIAIPKIYSDCYAIHKDIQFSDICTETVVYNSENLIGKTLMSLPLDISDTDKINIVNQVIKVAKIGIELQKFNLVFEKMTCTKKKDGDKCHYIFTPHNEYEMNELFSYENGMLVIN
jgi:hypothetical protein